MLRRVLVQNVQSFAVLLDNLFLPGHQLVAEVKLVPLAHERLAFGWPVALGQDNAGWPRASLAPPFDRGFLELDGATAMGAAVERCLGLPVGPGLGLTGCRFAADFTVRFAHARFPNDSLSIVCVAPRAE